ncbi:MAG: phosphoadenosine phosphosulfate reductase family protein [Ketobacter sp.]|nr:phosphoadenosine phosphosulfate reductase family protein [Ketobacter sp.]
MKQPSQIIGEAIEQWKPAAIIAAYSGGYDSMCMTHYVLNNIKTDVDIWAIDTKLSSDGWLDWVISTGGVLGGDVNVYDNEEGFNEYKGWVEAHGQPYTKLMHSRAYRRLKDTAFATLLKKYKKGWRDKVLFLSGIRADESPERSQYNPVNRRGKSNAIFANPIFYWTKQDIFNYRMAHELPINPFYETVGGSGDCQCNWGKFITLRKLKQHSPNLAAGNVARIDELSKRFHGYGWDMTPSNQCEMFEDFEDDGEMTSPFLCSGCSRDKSPTPNRQAAEEDRLLQMGLFD